MKTPWRRIATRMPGLEVGTRIGKVLISRDFGSRSPARQGREDAKDLRPHVKLTGGRRQVLVEESGLRARASPVRQGRDLDDLLAAWKRDAHEISRPKRARRLDGLV